MEELFQHYSVFRTTPSTLLGISKCIASRDMDIFHILYHCKAAALKNEGEQRQKSAHNCLAKRKLADRLFFPCPSLLTLFLSVCCILFGHDARCCCLVETAIFPPHTMHSFFSLKKTIATSLELL